MQFPADSIALVSGAGGDIGRAVSIRLAAAGVRVVAADLPSAQDRLAETAQLCDSQRGPETQCLTFDVTHEDQVADAFSEMAQGVGVPGLLFNNAGYQGEFSNLADASVADLRRVLEVNVAGVFIMLQAFAAELQRQGRSGAVVNTASMAGVSGAPNMAAYSASKAAVVALTKSAAKDLAPFGIRVNAISPAFIGPGVMWDKQVDAQAQVPSQYFPDDSKAVAEQMINSVPLRRYGSTDEVASVVEFLLSDGASYVTGVNMEVAGGAT